MRARVNLRRPQFLTGFGVEGAEAAVIGRANKDQSACGSQRAAEIRPAGFLFVFRQPFGNAQHGLPDYFARVDIDCQKTAPRWLLARPAHLRMPESRRGSQWTRARPRRAPALWIPLHLPDAAQILRVD